MFYPAVQSVGKTVLIIKDNKVIGRGWVGLMSGSDFVGIRMDEGEIMEQIKDLTVVKLFTTRHSYFRFDPFGGEFIGNDYDPDRLDEGEVLEDIRVVDEVNLRYGMVPDTFKDIEGYRS